MICVHVLINRTPGSFVAQLPTFSNLYCSIRAVFGGFFAGKINSIILRKVAKEPARSEPISGNLQAVLLPLCGIYKF